MSILSTTMVAMVTEEEPISMQSLISLSISVLCIYLIKLKNSTPLEIFYKDKQTPILLELQIRFSSYCKVEESPRIGDRIYLFNKIIKIIKIFE